MAQMNILGDGEVRFTRLSQAAQKAAAVPKGTSNDLLEFGMMANKGRKVS